MILKQLLVKLIKLYQYISPAFGQKCRYYPTCSEYAIWEFQTDNIIKAFFKSILRILRCNQLFRGGIDYPVVKKNFKNVTYGKKKVIFWYIPIKDNKYRVIKVDNG